MKNKNESVEGSYLDKIKARYSKLTHAEHAALLKELARSPILPRSSHLARGRILKKAGKRTVLSHDPNKSFNSSIRNY